MKKILAIVLMLMMALSLMACESKTTESPTLEEELPIVNEIPVDTLSAPYSCEILNKDNPIYYDHNVTITINDNNGFMFIGDTFVDWEIEGYDDGVLVVQDKSFIIVSPQLANTELTVSILGSNDVKYFITFVEHLDNTFDVTVERLVMDDENPICGIGYAYN